MNRPLLTLGCALAMGPIAGCNPAAVEAPPRPSPPVASRPAERRDDAPPAARRASVEVTYDTDRDRTFADFLREKSGGMLKKAAVGIERRGVLRVELDRSVAPEDTLDLTKSLMAGARKDFPDKPILLSVFDPNGEPVLKARYRVGQGVDYKLAGEPNSAPGHRVAEDEPAASPEPAAASSRSGATEADRKFAEWAEEHGKAYLRYVEADLERHGRLWFGVTREVKPADVPDLTRSLLEGARKQFPRGELVAVVFDPNGDKIGKAHLTGADSIRWER